MRPCRLSGRTRRPASLVTHRAATRLAVSIRYDARLRRRPRGSLRESLLTFLRFPTRSSVASGRGAARSIHRLHRRPWAYKHASFTTRAIAGASVADSSRMLLLGTGHSSFANAVVLKPGGLHLVQTFRYPSRLAVVHPARRRGRLNQVRRTRGRWQAWQQLVRHPRSKSNDRLTHEPAQRRAPLTNRRRLARPTSGKDPRQAVGTGAYEEHRQPAGGPFRRAYSARNGGLVAARGLVIALRAPMAVAAIWPADAPGGLQ